MTSSNDEKPAQRAASGRGLILVSLVTALVAVGGAGFAVYLSAFANPLQGEIEDLRRQAEMNATAARSESDAARRALDGMNHRLEDALGINKSLREEVLGLSERARLIEEALAGMAERRLDGATALRLNEAEFLLQLGAERLKLFGDVPSAVEAMRLADGQLAAVSDPLLTSVRQTLAAEIDELSKLPAVDRTALAADLDRVLADLPQLPSRSDSARLAGEVSADASIGERLAATFASFVRIERAPDNDAALVNPLNADLARSVIALDLSLAKAALVGNDSARYHAALERAQRGIGAALASDNERVAAARALVERAALARLDALPTDSGRALVELRNLRSTRKLAHDPVEPRRTP